MCKGDLVLSKADLARLPENFLATINASLAQEGASLALSEQTRETGGGFVLLYDGIEENCTFDALFDSLQEQLLDEVHAILFAS